MLLDRRTHRELAVESIEGRVVSVEVLDVTVEEVRAKCGEVELGDCLGGVLIIYTRDVGAVKSLGVEVVDVFDLGGEYAVVAKATPEQAAKLYKTSAVTRVEKSKEVQALRLQGLRRGRLPP